MTLELDGLSNEKVDVLNPSFASGSALLPVLPVTDRKSLVLTPVA